MNSNARRSLSPIAAQTTRADELGGRMTFDDVGRVGQESGRKRRRRIFDLRGRNDTPAPAAAEITAVPRCQTMTCDASGSAQCSSRTAIPAKPAITPAVAPVIRGVVMQPFQRMRKSRAPAGIANARPVRRHRMPAFQKSATPCLGNTLQNSKPSTTSATSGK